MADNSHFKDINILILTDEISQNKLNVQNRFLVFIEELMERKYSKAKKMDVNIGIFRCVDSKSDWDKYNKEYKDDYTHVIAIITEHTPMSIALSYDKSYMNIISIYEYCDFKYVPFNKEDCQKYFCSLFPDEVLSEKYYDIGTYTVLRTFAGLGIVEYNASYNCKFKWNKENTKKLIEWLIKEFTNHNEIIKYIRKTFDSTESFLEQYIQLTVSIDANPICEKLNKVISQLDLLKIDVFVEMVNELKNVKEMVEKIN